MRAPLFVVCGLALLGSVVSCAQRENVSPIPSVSDEAKYQLEKPVNCTTARNDLKVLEDEKASVGKQILSGVRTVFPIAAVAGILMGDYSDRVSVATGQYNEDIDRKIKQIKTRCQIK